MATLCYKFDVYGGAPISFPSEPGLTQETTRHSQSHDQCVACMYVGVVSNFWALAAASIPNTIWAPTFRGAGGPEGVYVGLHLAPIWAHHFSCRMGLLFLQDAKLLFRRLSPEGCRQACANRPDAHSGLQGRTRKKVMVFNEFRMPCPKALLLPSASGLHVSAATHQCPSRR
jgi:hypothetical protein